jgi:hypothetical protein
MRLKQLICGLSISFLAAATIGTFGASRKPGLWEFASTTTWQRAPSAVGQNDDFLKERTRTSQVCLTADLIDQEGALLPHSRGQCFMENKHVESSRLTADYVCEGLMTGRGVLKSEWLDSEHVIGSLHFAGTIRVGSEDQPVEWTTDSKGLFKSEDCGNVKPRARMPQR